MAFSIRDLISGKRIAKPVTATLEEKAEVALDRMIKNDFSQLPVVDGERRPKGLITHASILDMVRHSGARLGSLTVDQSMEEGEPRTYELDSDLFHLLNELQRWDAALVVRSDRQLEAIVTSADAADFLRGRLYP
jgi:predicted transcriptional regulator